MVQLLVRKRGEVGLYIQIGGYGARAIPDNERRRLGRRAQWRETSCVCVTQIHTHVKEYDGM